MPNGHDSTKQYGPHKYADHDGTSDCEHGCGCWMGPMRSGGPIGVDPGGACPNNPVDGHLQGGDYDLRTVVEQRISNLSRRASVAEAANEKLKKRVGTKKTDLADQLEAAQAEILLLRGYLSVIANTLQDAQS